MVYCMLRLLKIWKLGYQALNQVGRKKNHKRVNFKNTVIEICA